MKEIKKLKATIRATLVSNRRAMSVQQLRDEWTGLGNDASKFNNLMKRNGWSGWEDVKFQRTFSDIMKFSFKHGKLMVEYVPNEGTKELTDLITKTKMSMLISSTCLYLISIEAKAKLERLNWNLVARIFVKVKIRRPLTVPSASILQNLRSCGRILAMKKP